MSLNSKLLAACPLFLQEDKLALHPDARVLTHGVFDQQLQAKHFCTSTALELLLRLDESIKFAELSKFCATTSISRPQLLELLGFLNTQGLLLRRSALFGSIRREFTTIKHRLIGVTYAPFGHRRRPSLGGLFVECLAVARPVLVLAAFTAVIAWIYLPNQRFASILLGIGALTLITTFVHELCHVLLARTRTRRLVIVRSGIRIGILHEQLPVRLEIASSIAGPLAGLASGLLLGVVCAIQDDAIMAATAYIVGFFHLLSLLPSYSDGATLFTILRKRFL